MPEQVVVGLKREGTLVEFEGVEALGLAGVAAEPVLGPLEREEVTAPFVIFKDFDRELPQILIFDELRGSTETIPRLALLEAHLGRVG
jgi:hypothetical protein